MTAEAYPVPELVRRLNRIEDKAAILSENAASQRADMDNLKDDVVGLRNDFKSVTRALIGFAFSFALGSSGIIFTIVEVLK